MSAIFASENQDSIVMFENSQGEALSANILRMRRYTISFEVYNPYSILQLSEVLKNFRIRVDRRLIYEGEAVVSNMVNTGVLIVCEVTLGEGWKEVDLLYSAADGESLTAQFEEYVKDWQRANEVSSSFKLSVADMHNMVIGVQRWFEQVDLGIRSKDTQDRTGLEQEVISEVEGQLMEELGPMMKTFEKSAQNVRASEQAAHKFYVRRLTHPLLLCSPFVYRVFSKPLGYAGDYEMVNMMLRDPYEGSSLFAKMLNKFFLNMEPVQAHRNRIDYLVKILKSQSGRVVSQGRRLKVLNLGCGPAQELQRFLRNEEICDRCDFTLLDFNKETIDYTKNLLIEIKSGMARQCNITMIERSVHQLLKQSSRGDVDMDWESYDLVYCAGLFDYLSQKVCKRLTKLFTRLTRPGGLVIVTNVASVNPRIGFMEYVVEWNLVYRNDKEMLDLAPLKDENLLPELKREATGVNLFLEIRKKPVAS